MIRIDNPDVDIWWFVHCLWPLKLKDFRLRSPSIKCVQKWCNIVHANDNVLLYFCSAGSYTMASRSRSRSYSRSKSGSPDMENLVEKEVYRSSSFDGNDRRSSSNARDRDDRKRRSSHGETSRKSEVKRRTRSRSRSSSHGRRSRSRDRRRRTRSPSPADVGFRIHLADIGMYVGLH